MAGAPETSMGLGIGAELDEAQRRRLDESRRWAEEREQQYFRGYVVPKHAQKGLNKLLIGKGVPEEKGKKEEAPKEEVIPEGEREEETPTIKIREYPALKIEFYSKRETPKEDYERAVRVQALLILENEIAVLGKGRAWDIYSKIQGEKVRNPGASLFNLIQEEIRELKTKPDEGIEAGLKAARNFLVETAKAHGIFEDVKGLIDEAQKEDWGQAKIEFRERINVASLEHTARGIEGWTTDFAGMIDEYMDAAMLNMDLAELRARGKGETQKAKDIKREIDLRGWGNPPTGLEKMAKEYYEEVGEKEEEAIEIKRVVIDRDLSDEEKKQLEIYERDILEACLNDIQKAVDLVGDNVNIYPYKEYLVDSTVDNLRRYVKEKREEVIDINVQNKKLRAGKDLPDRTEYLLGRLEQTADWLEGNAAMLAGAGVVLQFYFKSWEMLAAVKKIRKDVRGREMNMIFAGPKSEKVPGKLEDAKDVWKRGWTGWELGKEIIFKQNQAFSVLRAVAGAHRHKERNLGEKIENDYFVTDNQSKFIERIFASKKKRLRTKVAAEEQGGGERKVDVDFVISSPKEVEAIIGLFKRDGILKELEDFFSKEKNKDQVKTIVVGDQHEVTKQFINSLRESYLTDRSLWVDGVEWRIDQAREILGVFEKSDLEDEHKKQETEEEIEQIFKKEKSRKIIIGENVFVTKEWLGSFGPTDLRGRTLWIDGVEYKIDKRRPRGSLQEIKKALEAKLENNERVFIGEEMRGEDLRGLMRLIDEREDKQITVIDDPPTRKEALRAIKEELSDKIHSGDKVFLGKLYEVNADNYRDRVRRAGRDEQVAVTDNLAAAIDNLFVMSQISDDVDYTRRRLQVMIEPGKEGKKSIWERLEERGADVDQLIQEFEGNLESYREDVVNKHVVDMARIALLYYLEGADLGWGFEYAIQEIGKGDKKLKVTKRTVESGGNKAATDIGAALRWLLTQAGSNWKEWTDAPIPFDKETAKQILEHYPGWAPKKTNGKWEIRFMGEPIEMDAPTYIDFAFFYTQEVPVQTEKGLVTDRRIMDLIKDKRIRLKMSDIPFVDLMRDEARYTQFIDEAQSRVLMPLTEPVDRDMIAQYYKNYKETMKGVWMTARHIGGKDLAEKLIPILQFSYMGLLFNMFPGSPNPGIFDESQVERELREMALDLRDLNVRGDPDMGKRMERSLRNLYKQFYKPCDKLRIKTGKKLAFGR